MNVGIQPYYWSIQSVRLGENEAKELCATIRKGHFLPASRFRVLCEKGDNRKLYWRSVMKIYHREISRFKFRASKSLLDSYCRQTEEVKHWLKHQKQWRKL